MMFSKNFKIGFMKGFPSTGTPLNKKTYMVECRGLLCSVDVFITKVTLGEYHCYAISTSLLNLNDYGVNTHGTNCHLQEAQSMRNAVKMYGEEHPELVMGEHINDWPFCKILVNNGHQKFLK